MAICFMIQPFDRGKFDKRFKDVFAPAIEVAGLTPYRVDQDPNSEIPIAEIESKIRDSAACLADISNDNPNVWFELGFALAARKVVVLVCSDERKGHFPFDIRHRTIISYKTDSPSDYETLREEIATRLKARLENLHTVGEPMVSSPEETFGGFESHEVALLLGIYTASKSPEDTFSKDEIHRMMEAAGFAPFATRLALDHLLEEELLFDTEVDYPNPPELEYGLAAYGYEFLKEHRHQIGLHNRDTRR